MKAEGKNLKNGKIWQIQATEQAQKGLAFKVKQEVNWKRAQA